MAIRDIEIWGSNYSVFYQKIYNYEYFKLPQFTKFLLPVHFIQAIGIQETLPRSLVYSFRGR